MWHRKWPHTRQEEQDGAALEDGTATVNAAARSMPTFPVVAPRAACMVTPHAYTCAPASGSLTLQLLAAAAPLALDGGSLEACAACSSTGTASLLTGATSVPVPAQEHQEAVEVRDSERKETACLNPWQQAATGTLTSLYVTRPNSHDDGRTEVRFRQAERSRWCVALAQPCTLRELSVASFSAVQLCPRECAAALRGLPVLQALSIFCALVLDGHDLRLVEQHILGTEQMMAHQLEQKQHHLSRPRPRHAVFQDLESADVDGS